MENSQNPIHVDGDITDHGAKERKAYRQQLAQKGAEARAELGRWGRIECAGVEDFTLSHPACKYHMQLGGAENIAAKHRFALLDVDGDGEVSVEELESNKEMLADMVSHLETMYLNATVVAALVLSIVWSIPVSQIEISEISEEFFTTEGVWALAYVYIALTTLTVNLASCMILVVLRYYLQLTDWMPTMEDKIWFASDNYESGKKAYILQVIVASALLAAVPFGAAVSISPSAGLITALCIVVPILVAMLGGLEGLRMGDVHDRRSIYHLYEKSKRYIDSGSTKKPRGKEAIKHVDKSEERLVDLLEKADLSHALDSLLASRIRFDDLMAQTNEVFLDGVLKDCGITLPGERLRLITELSGLRQ